MPSARANIRAKFIAQIETSNAWAAITRAGRGTGGLGSSAAAAAPLETSAPNATTRIARVTGQEISSDVSMASLLASLKSDHMPDAPVTLTACQRRGRRPGGP